MKPTNLQGGEQSKTQEGQSPPALGSKNEYLYYVGTKDAIKEEVRWRYGLQLMEQTMAKTNSQSKEKKKEPNKTKPSLCQSLTYPNLPSWSKNYNLRST